MATLEEKITPDTSTDVVAEHREYDASVSSPEQANDMEEDPLSLQTILAIFVSSQLTCLRRKFSQKRIQLTYRS
jgi:hypothetical protein